MRTILRASLIVMLGAPAWAGGWEGQKLDFTTPALMEGLAQLAAAAPRWTPVSMNIYGAPGSCDVSDPALRISLRGSRDSGGRFFFNGSAGSQFLSFNAYPVDSMDPRRGYSLGGAWINLSVFPSGGGYSINGRAGSRNIWLQASPMAGGGFSLYGQMGLNLHASGLGSNLWVSGSVDLEQFDETSLAALGAVLSVLHDLPAPARPISAARGNR